MEKWIAHEQNTLSIEQEIIMIQSLHKDTEILVPT